MKLNYNVDLNKGKKEDNDTIKNETKLSMQNDVLSALASKMPSANPGMPGQAPKQGWGKTM